MLSQPSQDHCELNTVYPIGQMFALDGTIYLNLITRLEPEICATFPLRRAPFHPHMRNI